MLAVATSVRARLRAPTKVARAAGFNTPVFNSGVLARVPMEANALHLAIVAWHHFVKKDGVLARMLPPGRKAS